MVPASSSHLKKIRTFAQDIDDVRATRLKAAPAVATSSIPQKPVVPSTTTESLPAASQNPKNKVVIPTKPTRGQTEDTTTKVALTPIPPRPKSAPLQAVTHQPAPVKLEASATRDASYPAIVITDTKTKRFNLASAVRKSLSTWWKNRQTTPKKPTYTVPAAELRKGVIEKATTTTARATTQDHKEIVARLKAEKESRQVAMQSTVTTPSSVTTQRVITPTTSWETDTTTATPSREQSVPVVTQTVHEPEVVVPTFVVVPEVRREIVIPTITRPQPTPTVPETPRTPEEPPHQEYIAAPTVPTIKAILPTIPDLPEPEEEIIEDETPVSYSFTVPIQTPEDTPEYEEINPIVVKEVSLFEPESSIEEEPIEDIPVIIPRTVGGIITPRIPDTDEDIAEIIPAPQPVVTPVVPVSITSPAPRPVEENLPTLPASMQGVRRQIENRREQLQSGAIAASTPSPYSQSWQRFLPIGITIAVVLLAGGTISYFVFVTPHTVETPAPTTTTTGGTLGGGVPTTLLANNAALTIATKSKSALYQSLSNLSTDTESLQLVAVQVEKTGEPLYRDDLLNLMSQNINADFRNNITQFSVGSYRGNPVIIIKIADVPVAQGALFTWEKSMSRDLSPWFGPAITTKSTVSLSNFTDTTSGNHDVRVLKNTSGVEQITYGFANPGTIIITNTTASFLNIATTYTQ